MSKSRGDLLQTAHRRSEVDISRQARRRAAEGHSDGGGAIRRASSNVCSMYVCMYVCMFVCMCVTYTEHVCVNFDCASITSPTFINTTHDSKHGVCIFICMYIYTHIYDVCLMHGLGPGPGPQLPWPWLRAHRYHELLMAGV